MIRPPAITTARLAQGAPEAASATAMKVPADAATQHARATRMLQEFGAALRATALGNTALQTWAEHAGHLERRRLHSSTSYPGAEPRPIVHEVI